MKFCDKLGNTIKIIESEWHTCELTKNKHNEWWVTFVSGAYDEPLLRVQVASEDNGHQIIEKFARKTF